METFKNIESKQNKEACINCFQFKYCQKNRTLRPGCFIEEIENDRIKELILDMIMELILDMIMERKSYFEGEN